MSTRYLADGNIGLCCRRVPDTCLDDYEATNVDETYEKKIIMERQSQQKKTDQSRRKENEDEPSVENWYRC